MNASNDRMNETTARLTTRIPFAKRGLSIKTRLFAGIGINVAGVAVLLADGLRLSGLSI